MDTLGRRPLGRSGIEVSSVGLGGNTFGPPRLDQDATTSVVRAALDAGVNFVDTAIVYGEGWSESFIGRALHGRRDEMVLATKCNFFHLGEQSPADHVRAQVRESLGKLDTDRIDLLQVHFPSDEVPVEELLGVLDELVRDGMVRAVGACNYASWRLAEAQCAAHELGTTTFVTVQNHHNLLARESDPEVLPYCRRNGIGFLPYHPLAGGFLTGKYRAGERPPAGTRGAAGSPIVASMRSEQNWQLLDQLEGFAAARGRAPGELAIAWLLADAAVSSVIAGVSNPQQLQANIAAATWVLSETELLELAEILVPVRRTGPERPPYG